MLRRILACLALITGLAAAGAPVHASAAAAVAEQVQSGLQGKNARTVQDCSTVVEDAQSRNPQENPLPCKRYPTIQIVIPTVLLGIDRAYE